MILTFLGYIDDTSSVFRVGEQIEVLYPDNEGTLYCRCYDPDSREETRRDSVWPEETNAAEHPLVTQMGVVL